MVTQEFELLELNLIHTQAKYNSPGWKWSRAPELTFAKKPEAVWWQVVRTSLLFLNWRKVKPASYDRRVPPWQGTGSSPSERSVLPLDSSLPLASLLFFRGLLFKGLFVGQLGHMILGGKVESHSFTVCVSLQHTLYTFLLLYYICQSLSCGEGLGDCSVYWKLNPHHQTMRSGPRKSDYGNLKDIIFSILPLFTFILFGNAQGHPWTKINQLALTDYSAFWVIKWEYFWLPDTVK